MSQFCKCTLGEINKIIELASDKVCSDCFSSCLELDEFNKNAPGEGKVKASCFQRDSIKDKIMVYLFLIITFVLLFLALVKPQLAKWWKSRKRATSFSSIIH